MSLPRLGQYQLALQHPRTAFDDGDLKGGAIELSPMGLPKVISGGFALTYHVTSGGREWAVRCFHREAAGLERRYQAISAAVGSAPSRPFVPVSYLPRGVLVEGNWHPITKMPWLHAAPLNRAVERDRSPAALTDLARRFRELVAELGRRGVAHGDLQHGNILVDGAGRLHLVDYDGMYVPALRGMGANESGHVHYQHPGRAAQFDCDLDRFSSLVIYLALTALAAEPTLWDRHTTGDNLLFKRSDFLDPSASPLFKDLRGVATVRPLAERLASICAGAYDAVPVLEQFIGGSAALQPSAARRRARSQPAVRRHQFDVLAVTDTAALKAREGDVVTIVGRVTGVRRGLTRFGKPYAFLTFGAYRQGCFTLAFWAPALESAERSRPLDDWKGRWVQITGLMMVYRPRAGGAERPQITVSIPAELRRLRDDQVRDLLGADALAEAPAARRAAGAGATRDRAAALNRLYGGPPPAGAKTGRTARAHATAARTPPLPARPVAAFVRRLGRLWALVTQ